MSPCAPDPRLAEIRELPFTGRLLVGVTPDLVPEIEAQFADRVDVSLRALVDVGFAPDLGDRLDALGDPPTSRLLRVWSVAVTRARHQSARMTSPRESLNAFFTVDLHGRTLPELRRAAAKLGTSLSVRTVVVEPRVRPSSPAPIGGDDLTSAEQGYVFGDHAAGSGKSGVDAESVWPFYDGSGVSVVQLDTGFKLQHVDLPTGLVLLDASMQHSDPNHGTMGLGVYAAVHHSDGTGIVGVSPEVTIPGVVTVDSVPGGWDIPNAIGKAIDVLPQPGGILVIEVDTPTADIANPPSRRGLPVEVIEAWRLMIKLATGNGISVVESGGNPASSLADYDLDAVVYNPTTGSPYSFGPGTTYSDDSGAIIVGACGSTPVADDRHRVLAEHWHGKRIDCYAWGENVYTTACDDGGTNQCGTAGPADVYYEDFNATSSATAIVAGVVALIQEMCVATTGAPAQPLQLRAILHAPGNGTPVERIAGGLTGRLMPDLGKIAENLGAFPDVYVRDALADVGVEPYDKVSMSPDVFVKVSPVVYPIYADRSLMIPNDAILPDEANHLFLRVGNLCPALGARNLRARIYWSSASTLPQPADWNPIGDFALPDLPAGGSTLAGPFTWTPSSSDLPPGAHACFIVILDQPYDPAPIPDPSLVDWDGFRSFVGSSNNVAWRNFNAAVPVTTPFGEAPDPGERAGADFFVRGVPEGEMEFDIEVRLEGVPDDVRLLWSIPGPLFDLLSPRADRGRPFEGVESDGRRSIRLSEGGVAFRCVPFPRNARFPVSLGFFPPPGLEGPAGHVAFIQRHRGLEVGRVTWSLEPTAAAGHSG
jgi:hypothetical protein